MKRRFRINLYFTVFIFKGVKENKYDQYVKIQG